MANLREELLTQIDAEVTINGANEITGAIKIYNFSYCKFGLL